MMDDEDDGWAFSVSVFSFRVTSNSRPRGHYSVLLANGYFRSLPERENEGIRHSRDNRLRRTGCSMLY
jgi:hypothetical protein